MYSVGKNKGSLSLAGVSNSGIYMSSPTTGEKIKLNEKVIASENVWDSVFKSIYNSRSHHLMTPATVRKILPSIREDGRNTVPVIAVMSDSGKLEILSGMKRSYAVSISPGTNLIVHVAEKMSDEDKKRIAKTSDLHEKPSFLDTALSIKKYQEEIGDAFTVRSAGEIFGVSKSSVTELLKFASLPTELFLKFPAANFVTWRFLKAVAESNHTDDEILEAISDIQPINTDVLKVLAEDADEVMKAECKQMERMILDALVTPKAKIKKSFQKGSVFEKRKLVSGVESKPETKGAVSIKLSREFIESELGKKLIEMITAND